MSDGRSRSTVYFEGLCRFAYSYFNLLKTNLYSMNADNTIVSTSDYILVYRHTYTHWGILFTSGPLLQFINHLVPILIIPNLVPKVTDKLFLLSQLISYLFWVNWFGEPFDVGHKE